MKPHKHAALIAEYAKDAMETETPWERWECRSIFESWVFLIDHPEWREDAEYRRKPRTIRIGDYDVPEPCRKLPCDGNTIVHIVEFDPYGNIPRKTAIQHASEAWIKACLDAGLIHLTREAAEIHARALLSFTAKGGSK